MSRSGYTDDFDQNWATICWRGAVASAIKGKRGQAFLQEMIGALDALENKRLITDDLVKEGDVCAIGAVAIARRLDVTAIDPEDRETIAGTFGIAPALAAEIMYMNDEWYHETPEARYTRMREWIASHLRSDAIPGRRGPGIEPEGL